MRYYTHYIFLIFFAVLALSACAPGVLILSEEPVSESETLNTLPVKHVKDGVRVETLSDALNLALARNPELKAARHSLKASESAAKQAGLPPNPTVFTEFEEFLGTGPFEGTSAMAYRFGVSQEFPLGGKQATNRNVANSETSIRALHLSDEYLNLRRKTTALFLEVYRHQRALELEQKNLESIRKIYDGVMKRIEVGESSPLDGNRASVEFAGTELKLARVKVALNEAKRSLSALWDGEADEIGSVRITRDVPSHISESVEFEQSIKEHPHYRKILLEREKASLELSLAKSEGWPDVEIGGGVQYFNETGYKAYFIEASIPIPLFDRNQGGIGEARENLLKTEYETGAALRRFKNEFISTREKLKTGLKSLITMRKTILPAARTAFDSVRKAYMVGEVSYLDLQSATRTLIDTEREELNMTAEFYKLLADLEYYTGQDGFTSPTTSNKKE